MLCKEDGRPKCLFGDELAKTVKELDETSKATQKLTLDSRRSAARGKSGLPATSEVDEDVVVYFNHVAEAGNPCLVGLGGAPPSLGRELSPVAPSGSPLT